MPLHESVACAEAYLNEHGSQPPSPFAVKVRVPSSEAPLDVILFSTNDYLGLACHPQVRQAVSGAAASHGMGPRSAAIVAGHTSLHERLECRLASLKKAEACLLFPTGFSANIAAISALATDSAAALFSDELNHASLIDGCRLARIRGVQTHVFRHKDYHHLHELLHEHRDIPRKLVATDGVFSMDGDIADLKVLFLAKAACTLKICRSSSHELTCARRSSCISAH